jgi:hypothetical protein
VKNVKKLRLRCAFLFAVGTTSVSQADCTLTNTGIVPLNELGLRNYQGYSGGLYPNGANTRPPAHEAEGLQFAAQIQPLDAAGNTDTNNGKIVLLSLGVSNTTQEWASKGTNNFTHYATNDPSVNPRLRVVDGAFGGQDAITWTNPSGGNWAMVITQRLAQAGATTNQVQAMWLKQALATPLNYGIFPSHAQDLQNDLAIILRIAKAKYPNLKLVYISCRTRAYTSVSNALNPEPFAFETGFADKWVIEDQLTGRNNLNCNPTKGPVKAPWICWGPYIWADGLTTRSDGFTWLCSDLETDYTHPSPGGGVPKVARQLLAFFKTDPTATPWFLRKTFVGQPPTCSISADVNDGVMPLTVHFAANASDPDGNINDYEWTFEDGDYSTNPTVTKIFPTPGTYHATVTVMDNSGNTTSRVAIVNVTTTTSLWRQAKFTTSELGNPAISGDSADPDHDGLPNLLEYAMGLDPKTVNSITNGAPRVIVTNGVFTLTYQHYKPAADVTLSVEASTDFTIWVAVPASQLVDNGITETLVAKENISPLVAKFYRFKVGP